MKVKKKAQMNNQDEIIKIINDLGFTKLNQERYNIFSVVYELVFITIDYFP